MLLAIDTSTAQIGLALYDGESIAGELVWQSRAHHTEQLAPALAGLLERVSVKMDSIEALGVAIGPGSFTSLRVGLAFVKGLALARHLPLIGIPTLDIVVAAIPLPGSNPAGRRLQTQSRTANWRRCCRQGEAAWLWVGINPQPAGGRRMVQPRQPPRRNWNRRSTDRSSYAVS